MQVLDDATLAAGEPVPVSDNLLNNGSAESPASLSRAIASGIAHKLGLDGYVTPWFMYSGGTGTLNLLWLAGDSSFASFWGQFGSLNVKMPEWWYRVWKYSILIAAGGLALYFVQCVLENPRCNRRHAPYYSLLAVGIVLLLVQAMAPLLNRPDPNWLPQGRFLFPAIVPIAILTYRGWATLVPKRAYSWLFGLIFVGAFVMDGIAILRLASHSYCM